MMIKYRVREVAKDLDIPNKDVIDTLAKYFPEPKKYMTALTEEELDVVFEAFTQQRNRKSLDDYFAQRTEREEAPAQNPQPQAPAPQQPKAPQEKHPSRRRLPPEANRPSRPRRPRSLPPLWWRSQSSSPPAGWWIPAPPM